MKKHEESHDDMERTDRIGESASERLCALVLGELEAAEAAQLEEELAGSEELRAEKARLEATIGFLRDNAPGGEALSPGALDEIERAASPATPTQSAGGQFSSSRPWYQRTPLRAAAGLAALATGLLAGRAWLEREEAPRATDLAKQDAPLASPAEEVLLGEKLAANHRGAAPLEREEATLEDRFGGREVELRDEAVVQRVKNELRGRPVDGPVSEPEEAIEPYRFGKDAWSEGDADAGRRASAAAPGTAKELLDGFQLETYRGPGDSAPSGGAGSGSGPSEPAPTQLGLLDSSRSQSQLSKEQLKRLESLGYVQGADDFFLGHGQRGGSKDESAGEVRLGYAGGTPAPTSPQVLHVTGGGGPSSPGPLYPKLNTSGPSGPPAASSGGAPARARGELSELPSEKRFAGRRRLAAGVEVDVQDDDRITRMTADQLELYSRTRADEILSSCRRLPNERPADMFFRFWGDNPFELAQLDHLSTFSVDVDTASYALARRYLTDGHLPSKAQIRTEEFVNYFRPDVAPPTEGDFRIATELAPSRFGNGADAPSQRWMLRVGIRGREVAQEERKPLALTFVVDTSGSMKQENRLELVKHSLRLLVAQLDGQDSIAIVGFDKSASLVLPMTSAANRGIIEAALYGLTADGGTNAEAGLKLGYEVAAASLTSQAHNRVVLLSDGVANIGQTDQNRLNADVSSHRSSGIFLNTIGVGMGNHNDAFLEQLADKGDGLCNYVDSPAEARRALVENFTGAFEPIARDVKIQVGFDPSQVYRYRLLGYENRAIADADFRNDAVDAGEVGAGHQVVALYELETTGVQSSEPMVTVHLRWKPPTGAGRDPLEDAATEVSHSLAFDEAKAWEGTSLGYRRSALVAQFAEILRRSVHARGDSLDELLRETVKLAEQDRDPDLVEFLTLLQTSRDLIVRQAPRYDDLSNCIDSIRRNRILRAQYEELRQTEKLAALQELERTNEELEQRIRDLIRAELEQRRR